MFIRYLGLDLHKDSIKIAVAEADGDHDSGSRVDACRISLLK